MSQIGLIFEDGTGFVGAVAISGPEVSHQQILPAEDIERQKAVFVIEAVEEAAFLLTVGNGRHAVEIQRQLLWRLFEGVDEGLQHDLMDDGGREAGRPILKAAQGRGRSQRRVGVDGGLQREILPKRLVVVKVLISSGDGVDALPEKPKRRMLDAAALAGIWQSTGDAFGK